MCESSTPLQGYQNYSNSRVRGYGLLGELNLIIRQLERLLLKLAKTSVSALVYLLVGKSRGASQRCNWLVVGNGLVYALTSGSGTRSSGLAKSKLALLHDEPHLLYLES